MDREEIFRAVPACFSDGAVREREYYPEFRRSWEGLLRRTLELEDYFDVAAPSVFAVEQSFSGLEAQFHFDQLKIADWYKQESSGKKRVVFLPKSFRHTKGGGLSYHDSRCDYDPKAPESALDERERNIIAAAMPQLPPRLCVVYGNKWVESRFSALLNTRLSLFLIETDYVPAFLGSPFEVGLYLFMMDLCIIKENYSKVKDAELRKYLHIFRPSPMLRIKGLV